VRFISNACCRALKGLPIVLRQDIVFDYLYVKDLVKITMWFIENSARHRAYNVCSGRPVALTERRCFSHYPFVAFRRCTLVWHGAHSVTKFSSVSAPEWLRNSLWCTSRFDIVPHD
jgi:hypothetical protein